MNDDLQKENDLKEPTNTHAYLLSLEDSMDFKCITQTKGNLTVLTTLVQFFLIPKYFWYLIS